MDIVKQRRKRLMAWILALVLCVGMWQGSVYATEGEGDGKDPAITEGSDESVEPQSVDPQNTETDPDVPMVDGTINYNVMLHLIDKSNAIDEDLLQNVSLQLECILGENKISWVVGENGMNTDSKNAIITANAFKNGDYKHHVLGWKSTSDGEIVTAGNTLDLNAFIPADQIKDNVGSGEAYAVLGKSVMVTFWESDASGNIKGDTPLGNSVNVAEGDTNKVTLPRVGSKNGFATGWRVEGSSDPIESEFTIEFDKISEFEEKIRVGAVLSTTISSPGKFYLCPETKYTLSSGKWKMDDGYTYNGDRTFFVSTKEGEYSFSQ